MCLVNPFLNFLNSTSDRKVNSTPTNLYSEGDRVFKISDFLSVILCNVIYRIMTKAISNRLKEFIKNVISRNQNILWLEVVLWPSFSKKPSITCNSYKVKQEGMTTGSGGGRFCFLHPPPPPIKLIVENPHLSPFHS